MQGLWQDLRYGLRGARQAARRSPCSPSWTWRLGIGAATTIFSVIQNVLLDPFPYTGRATGSAAFRSATRAAARPGGRDVLPGRRVPRLPGPDPRLRGRDRRDDRGRPVYDRRRHRAVQRRPDDTATTSSSWAFPPSSAARSPPTTRSPARRRSSSWAQDVGEALQPRSRPSSAGPSCSTASRPRSSASCRSGSRSSRPISTGRSCSNRADPALKGQLLHVPGAAEAGRHARAGGGRCRRHRPPRWRRSTRRNYPKQFTVKVVSWVDSIVGPFKQTLYTLAAAVGIAAR